MMKRGGWIVCLLGFSIGALATPVEKEAAKNATLGRTDTLLEYLEKIKKSPFNIKTEGTEGKRHSGGVTSETLERIKEMVSQRHSHGAGTFPNSPSHGVNMFEFGELSLGHPGAHQKINKPYHSGTPYGGGMPPYGSSGTPPYGGEGTPPYGGSGTPPYGGGGSPPYGGGGTPPYGGGGTPPYGGGGTPPYGGDGTPPYDGDGTPPYGGSGVKPPYGGMSYPYTGGGTYKPGDSLPGVNYNNQHPLSLYDYEHIWVQMLQEIYKILKDKYLLEDTQLASKVLDHLFKMLNDIKILSRHTVETESSCPKLYHRRGDLCLSVDFLTTFLDFYEARLYCQVVKGGDLVMWRDANEYADIQEFIKDIDSSASYSYWVGVLESDEDNDWRFIDGRAVDLGAPIWGVDEHKKYYYGGHQSGYGQGNYTHTGPYENGEHGYHAPPRKTRYVGSRRKQYRGATRKTSKGSKVKANTRRGGPNNYDGNTYPGGDKNKPIGEDTIYELEPGHRYDDETFGMLWNEDFHYLHPTNEQGAEEAQAIPLCQFIPERDTTNFQYGEMVYEGWNEYNEWSGWGDKDKDTYKVLPPHSHYKPYRPQKVRPQKPPYNSYGGGSYEGSPYGGSPYGERPYGGSPYGGGSYEGNSQYGGGNQYGGGGNPPPNPYSGKTAPVPDTPADSKKPSE